METEAVKEEIRKAIETKEAVKDSYDLLEAKLRDTEALLDQRNKQVDEQDLRLKEVFNRVDSLEVDLQNVNQQLQERK